MLCASFVEIPTGEVYTIRGDKRPRKLGTPKHWRFTPGEETVDDSRLAVAIKKELESADIIVSWYGLLHDVPLLNARLQVAGEEPFHARKWPNGSHLDLIFYATGTSLKIGSKKLDNVAKFFSLPNQKTPLDGKVWQRAGVGERAAMDLVVEHCEADTLVLRDTFPLLAPHVQKLVLPFSKWYPFSEQISL